MATNVRAQFAPTLLASDASTQGEAGGSAEVPYSIHGELWRSRDRRGHYTWLAGGMAHSLRGSTDWSAIANLDEGQMEKLYKYLLAIIEEEAH